MELLIRYPSNTSTEEKELKAISGIVVDFGNAIS